MTAILMPPLLKDDLVLILNAKHPLARRESVTVKELGKESFLAHNVKTASRLKVIEAFARQHTPLNITLELATVETIKRFVQQNIGLAFVPRMCVNEELERGTLATSPCAGSATAGRCGHASPGATHSHAVSAFLKVLRATCEIGLVASSRSDKLHQFVVKSD